MLHLDEVINFSLGQAMNLGPNFSLEWQSFLKANGNVMMLAATNSFPFRYRCCILYSRDSYFENFSQMRYGCIDDKSQFLSFCHLLDADIDEFMIDRDM